MLRAFDHPVVTCCACCDMLHLRVCSSNLNVAKLELTASNTSQQRGQTCAAFYKQECYNMLRWNVTGSGGRIFSQLVLFILVSNVIMIQVTKWSLKSLYFRAHNMSQHVATGWPNAGNLLCPTMLRYVALKRCDRLYWDLDWKRSNRGG